MPNEFQLEVWHVQYSEHDCDGCGAKIPVGKPMISNIESCCGSGCCRSLCFDCIKRAHEMVLLHEQS